MREWNEFKETVSLLVRVVIALLLFPAIIFMVAMWGKFLLTIYEMI